MTFVWANVALAVAAALVGPRLVPAERRWARLTASLVVFAAGAMLCVWAVSLVGQLSALALAVAATALGVTQLTGALPEPPAPRPAAPVTWLDRAGWFVLGTAAARWVDVVLFAPCRFSWDDLTYHAAVPAWWIQHGGVGLAPLTYQAYYALDAELLATWFVVTSGTFAQGNLVLLVWIGLVGSAGLALGDALGQPRGATAGLVGAALGAPPVVAMSRSFTANDLAVAAFFLAASALAATAWQGRRASGAVAVGSGLAAGMALGAKVSVAPAIAVLGVGWLLHARATRRPLPVAAFTVAAVVMSAYWYAANLWHTGNPLFPAAVGPLEGPFDAATQRATSIVGVLERMPDRLGPLVVRRLDWPVWLGLASLGGYAAALTALAVPRARPRWPDGAALLAATGLLLYAMYPWQPFSGTWNRPTLNVHTMVRYTTLPFVVGLLLLPSGLPLVRHPRLRQGLAWLLVGLGALTLATGFLQRVPEVAFWGLVVAGLQGQGHRLALPPRLRPWTAPAALAAMFLVLWATTADKERQTFRRLRTLFNGELEQLMESFRALDRLPPSRVAFRSNLPSSHTMVFPLYGRDLQHTPVLVGPSGRALPPLHERWRGEGWFDEWAEPAADPSTIRQNLRDADVDVLVVTRCHPKKEDDWPPAFHAVRRMEGATPVLQDDCTGIWRLPAGGE